MIKLRNYQEKAVSDVRNNYLNGSDSPALVLPTGAGKTVIFCHVASQTANRGKNALILVHRIELLRQTSRALLKSGVKHGLINPKFTPDPSAQVQVASVQTLVNRLDKITPPDLIIIDECHHASAGSWRKVINHFPDAKILGVTATPIRGDGKGLDSIFDSLIIGPQISDLIDMGYLVKPRIFGPPNKIDFSGVKIIRGDYDKAEVAQIMDKPTITGSAVDHYSKICSGVPAVVFCSSINHAEHVAEDFRSAGFKAYSVDGTMDDETRKRILDGLGDGSIEVVTSCDLISEGTDIPAIGCAILLRPTQSLGLYIQQVGRALRIMEGKDEAFILDHVGNVLNHGFPDDFREWTLEGSKRDKKSKNSEPSIRVSQCAECYAVFQPAEFCPYCGAKQKAREIEIEVVEGQLEELKRIESQERRVEVSQARSIEDLKKIEKEKGYKKGWAERLAESRSIIKGQKFFNENVETKTPKSVKAHNCDLCKLEIEKGEIYNNSSSNVDGIKYAWKSHIKCAEISSKIKGGFNSDEFKELIYVMFFNIPEANKNDALGEKIEKIEKYYLEII
jgi:DNA repair protein RadD